MIYETDKDWEKNFRKTHRDIYPTPRICVAIEFIFSLFLIIPVLIAALVITIYEWSREWMRKKDRVSS